MQIKLLITSVAVLHCMLFFACKKKDADIFETKWKVESIHQANQSIPRTTNEPYILEFTSNDTYKLKLDVNGCGGDYKIPQSGKISFEAAICTEICCDSEFAEYLIQLLNKMTGYEVNGDILTLRGDGEIKLKKY